MCMVRICSRTHGVSALYNGAPVTTEVEVSQSSWMISVPVRAMVYCPLTIHCKLSGAVNHESDGEHIHVQHNFIITLYNNYACSNNFHNKFLYHAILLISSEPYL